MCKLIRLFSTVAMFVFISCTGSRRLTFTSDNIQPGMTKAQVISKFGKPDRESFNKTQDAILYETLYYVYFQMKGTTYYYDYILDFKNGILVSMQHEPQIPPPQKTITVKNE